MENGKLWGGRFQSGVNEAANHFHSSISFDRRLYRQDITGSIAHAEMLGKQGIIPQADADSIAAALKEILEDIESGKIEFDEAAEDIHMNVETILTERVGEAGKRLHTGRSRNDQVALDTRMYVKDEIGEIRALLKKLMGVLLETAKANVETIMPGYTHLQKAQPVTLAHHCLAYFEMFKRDLWRLGDCYSRSDAMPLGAGALAGTTYPTDRDYVREKLGFARLCENSMDAVSDRDYVAELIFCASLIMAHLSRFCEEIILWAADEFKFVELSDEYSTGSSIMPQKKNPDMAELIRGKSGRVFGGLTCILTIIKGLPLAYNKDLQEDKEALFDAVDTVKACLTVFAGMFASLTFNEEKMLEGARGGYTNATDAADYLVKKGLPFRAAHEAAGKLVYHAIKQNKRLEQLPLNDFKTFSDLFGDDIYEALSPQSCVKARATKGGTAESEVTKAIATAERYLNTGS